MNTFDLILDLDKRYENAPVRIRQGDKSGTTIRASIYDHGTPLAGTYTSRVVIALPDREHYYRKSATYSGGIATVTIDETTAAAVAGSGEGYFQILSGSTVIASTQTFPVLVLPDATADATVPESYDTAIQEAIDGLNDAVADLPDTVEEILEQHHEWTTTVQDNSLTDAKLVQSGGILSRNARLMYRLANLLTHRTDEGTLAAISDAAKTPMAGLSVYGQSTQDGTPTPEAPVPIVSVEGDSEGNISLLAQGLNVAHPLPGTHDNKGITATVAEDGWITVSGTSTATSSATVSIGIGSGDPMVRVIEGAPTFALYMETEGMPLVSGEVELQLYGSDGEATNKGGYATASRTFTTLPDYISRIVVFLRAASNGKTYSGRFRFSLVRGDEIPAAYIPYVETVTPIDLDGHELRSLPDGTRDELTVDTEGHVTLVQRVGVYTVTGSESLRSATDLGTYYRAYAHIYASDSPQGARPGATSGYCTHAPFISGSYSVDELSVTISVNAGTGYTDLTLKAAVDTSEALLSAYAGATITYPLAEPITYDLGTVPLVPLVGPDLTAQTVPTAPFVLDAERDLNVTLARLEAAIAALA